MKQAILNFAAFTPENTVTEIVRDLRSRGCSAWSESDKGNFTMVTTGAPIGNILDIVRQHGALAVEMPSLP